MENFFTPEIPDDAIYHVGISGGKDSTAALLYLLHKADIPRENIDATFCDTGNEHQWTLDHVAMLSEKVHPIKTLKPERDFYELADHKRRFPGAKTRFCTQFLKIIPSQDHILELLKTKRPVVAVSGVRSDESDMRSRHLEWDFSGELLTISWRPLIRWSIKDVYAIHEEFGIPLNPLYAAGAERVGCFPCIMSRKAEIRMIAQKFPERIDMIRQAEQDFEQKYGRFSSFFPAPTVPERFRSKPYTDKEGNAIKVATIDDVVRWSMTGNRAQGHYTDHAPEPVTCRSGFCE